LVRYTPVVDWSDRATKNHRKGYVLVYVPEHYKSFDGGYYYEHRLVAERQLGRVLRRWESVHHISENKTDNSPNNLFICTRKEHDYAVWLTGAAA
jgi:hypothetical protein